MLMILETRKKIWSQTSVNKQRKSHISISSTVDYRLSFKENDIRNKKEYFVDWKNCRKVH